MAIAIWFGILLGLLVFNATTHLQIAFRTAWNRKQVSLIVCTVAIFTYDFATFLQYINPDLDRYFRLIRIQSIATPILLVFLVEFFSATADLKPSILDRSFQAALLLLGALRQFLPFLGFHSIINSMRPTLLPWGDTIFLLDSEPTVLLYIYILLVNGIMLAAFRFPLSMLRAGKSREAVFLFLALGLLFLSSLIDMAISAGWLRWLYTAETGYVAMAFVASLMVTDEVVRTAELKNSLEGALGEKEALIREIHHRVKNNLSVLLSLVRLQAGDEEDERMRSRLSTVVNRIYSIASVHDMAYGSDNFAFIELGAYLEALAHNVVLSFCAPSVVVEGLTPRGITNVPVDLAVPLGLVVNEIISNSVQHAFGSGGGRVWHTERITVTGDLRFLELEIGDDGRGWTPSAGEHKPGLGYQLIETLIGQIGARLEHGTEGGTVYHITVPLPRTNSRESRRS